MQDNCLLSSLGYEQYDARLCRLGWSLMAVLTSADGWRGSTPSLGVFPHLNPSRRSPCTKPIPDLPVLGLLVREPRTPHPAGYPVTVGPPAGERAKPHGSRWSAPRTNDLDPWGLVCSALAWADGVGMTRLPPQPPANLDQAAASILEPEVPAGGYLYLVVVTRKVCLGTGGQKAGILSRWG